MEQKCRRVEQDRKTEKGNKADDTENSFKAVERKLRATLVPHLS
jgi:hypothetical protein